MFTPEHLGLPPKFSSWRPGQLDAVEQIIADPRRFQVVCAPTGFGKSPMYMAAAKIVGANGGRTAICTSTKGLQDQLSQDFTQIIQDVRGQSNYVCTKAADFGIPGRVTVEGGPCKSGATCALRSEGCEYFDRYRKARTSEIVSTNYALWMYDTFKQGDESSRDGNLIDKRPVDMLILDEAHDAPGQLDSFLGEEIRIKDFRGTPVEWPEELEGVEDRDAWGAWAGDQVILLDEVITSRMKCVGEGKLTSEEIRRVQACKTAMRKLTKLSLMRGEWIIERKEEWGSEGEREGNYQHQQGRAKFSAPRKSVVVRFDPLWPKLYAESALFRQVKKVILVSATVRPKTADVLGLPAGEVTFREYGSSFPAQSRPVIHVPTVQMRHGMNDFQIMQWLGIMDRIMDGRMDRKGVIHTVSYERAKLILMNSRHSSRMLSHNSRDRQAVVEKFKSAKDNVILVSPSVDTGYDFPYGECEWQIIAKVPFEDNRGKVIRARLKQDPEYSNYMTAQTIVQMTGRGMRAADDKCETLVVDDNIQWFVKNNRKFFPQWWMEGYQGTFKGEGGIPRPLEKL